MSRSIRQLIATSNPDRFPLSAVDPISIYLCVRTDTLEDGRAVFLLADDDFQLDPAEDMLIVATDAQGVPQGEVDYDLYAQIRPWGNLPPKPIYDDAGDVVGQTRGGDATGVLGYAAVAGDPERALGDHTADDPIARLYPAENQPFAIEQRHVYFDDDYSGWGWRAEIVGGFSSRDPSVRAIAWYSDPECTQYVGTTGAFVEQQSWWQTDAEGNLLTVWATETPPGFRKGEDEPWHLAVLWASVQEGYATLQPGGQQTHLYWDRTQGRPPPSSGDWSFSGVTVESIVGAGVLGVTDSTVFVADELLRIKGEETTFVREHSNGIIVINPHVADCVGEEIEWQRAGASAQTLMRKQSR